MQENLIPVEVLQSKILSAKAKAVYALLAVMPSGWFFNKKLLGDYFKEKSESISTAVNELINAGFITTFQDFDLLGMPRIGYKFSKHSIYKYLF